MSSPTLRRSAVAAFAAALLLAACPGTPPAPPAGDYGDAPDGGPTGYPPAPDIAAQGSFPTLFNTANARLAGNAGIVHLDPASPLRFGREIDVEPDADVTDDDADDGGPTLVIGPLGQAGSLFFNVSPPAGDPANERSGFANVLLDLNQDGEWAAHDDNGTQVEEWVVKNFPVSVREGGFERLQAPPFDYGPTSARTLIWARLSLTPDPIDEAAFAALQGWDGSGPAAGYAEGETEDWFFPCEGNLNVDYPLTTDAFNSRLRPAAAAAGGTIAVTNNAAGPIRYVFSARAQVAVPFGLGFFYIDIDPANPQYNLTLAPVPPANVNPDPVVPLPDQQFTVQLAARGAAGDTATFNIIATLNQINPVLDPTRPPPPGADNRLGRILFHPLGPCLSVFTKTNDEPVYLEWP